MGCDTWLHAVWEAEPADKHTTLVIHDNYRHISFHKSRVLSSNDVIYSPSLLSSYATHCLLSSAKQFEHNEHPLIKSMFFPYNGI